MSGTLSSMADVAGAAAGGVTRIRVLAEDVAAKIAAGEVVERPASVVKELVENALDAGARRVVVELEDGGVRMIRVGDDGAGMGREDAVLAFTRHATSKLREEADLGRIATLGFRGEALPSIAAVADVELTSRTAEALGGVTVRVTEGRVRDVRDAGAPAGTGVTVRELFAPVPARRKFLKSTATELGHVVDLIARHALARVDVHFRLLHQGREVTVYPPVRSLEERVRQVFGAERVRGGRSVRVERLGLRLEGFAFSPQLSFASARYVHVFVNGRAVRDRGLQHAIVEGYASLIPRGRWPGAVVLLAVPPADVDVNVHPAKHEVRFRLARVVHDTVLGAIRGGLEGPQAAGRRDTGAVAEALQRYAAGTASADHLPLRGGQGAPFRGGGAPAVVPMPAAVDAGAGAAAAVDRPAARPHADEGFAALRFVGQVFRGYIVCEGSDRLVLVDQHAAHERIAFERLQDQYRAGAVERQTLLLPVTVDLDPRRAEALLGAARELHALGFDVEPFGERTLLVRAVPALLGACDPRVLVEDVADELSERGSQVAAAAAADAILGRIACHSVVRVGRVLTPAEVAGLLADLDGLAHGTNCAHGRPVSIEFSRGQVERMFGR
jgi:DNA mismatch repair protein MutL